VQRGPNGLFAYIVKADDTVAVQPLRIAQTQDGKAIVDEGLAVDMRVVVEGQYKLKPGSKVSEVQASAKAAETSKEQARSDSTRQNPGRK
jgi:membrane fusion protein, multidrug efflux system